MHQTDIVNFVLSKTVPANCMASGGIYRWTEATDDRDVPDTLSAIYEYPDKFHINYSCYFGNVHYGYGEQFCGNDGTIEVLNRQDLNFYPEKYRNAASTIASRPEIHLNGLKDFQEQDGAINHFRNFIEAVQGKGTVVAPPTAGQEAAISGHMATLSFKHGKKITWDNKAEKYQFV